VERSLSAYAEPNITDLLQREHPKMLTQSDPPSVDLRVADIQ